MITLALADDHPLFVTGIASFLATQPDLHVRHQAHDGRQLLEQLSQALVDVLLVDMAMPYDPAVTAADAFGGIETADRALAQHPDLRVIVLSMHVNADLILRMLDCGAMGYLAKNSDPATLVQAIRTVHANGYFFNELLPPTLVKERIRALSKRRELPSPSLSNPLSERETEVMHMICDGLLGKEIAQRLSISEGTVAAYRNSIFTKLGLRNQSELVAYAFRAGWVA